MSKLSVSERMGHAPSAYALACPYCGARAGQPCTVKRGRQAGLSMWPPHTKRVRLAIAQSRRAADRDVGAATQTGYDVSNQGGDPS